MVCTSNFPCLLCCPLETKQGSPFSIAPTPTSHFPLGARSWVLGGGARGTAAGGCFTENGLSDIFVFLYSFTVNYLGISEGALLKAVSHNEFVSISSLLGVLD